MDLACFHIPHFAAWALAQDAQDPALVVCAHGRVLACTPALDGTVAIGDPIERARRLAPHARFRLRDPAIERALWDHVLFRLYGLGPRVQPIPDPLRPGSGRGSRRRRRDDASGYLYETPASGLWDNGAWAWLQNADVDGLQALAAELGARVGRAPARPWALLAAAYADPGAVTTVPGPMIAAFLRQAPIGLLTCLRFSADLVERLGLFGMRAVGHAVFLTRRQLEAQFGDEGLRLHDLLHPPETQPAVAAFDPRVVRATHDFEWPVFEPADLQPVLHHLLAQLATRLDGRSARHLEVVLRGRGGHRRRAHRILREPSDRLDVLRRAADALLTAALERPGTAGGMPVGRSVHRLAVTLSGLTEVPARQASLFTARGDRLPALVRAVEARFPGRLTRPVRAHADPFFPEEEYRFEPVAR